MKLNKYHLLPCVFKTYLTIYLQQKLHSFNLQSSVKPVEHRYTIISLRSSEMTHQLEARFHPKGRLLGPAPQKHWKRWRRVYCGYLYDSPRRTWGYWVATAARNHRTYPGWLKAGPQCRRRLGQLCQNRIKWVFFLCDFSTCTTEWKKPDKKNPEASRARLDSVCGQ